MATPKHLHWTQRIALVQHNLHAASRTGNFTFFTNIQSAHFLDGTDYVASLSVTLGDEADKLFSVLDNLNSGIAWAHEDAFKTVYESLKDAAASTSGTEHCGEGHKRALHERLHAEIADQHAAADAIIDKMISSAVTIIQQLQPDVHEDAAHVFMLGTTFIADAVQVCLAQLAILESCIPDTNTACAESAYSTVRFAVSAAVSALKGVLNMMEAHHDPAAEAAAANARRPSSASTPSLASPRPRALSRTSGDVATGLLTPPSGGAPASGWNVFRRVSNAFQGAAAPSQKASITSVQSSTGSLSAGLSNATPTFVNASLKSPPAHKRGVSMPSPLQGVGHKLSPILATPATNDDTNDALKNPFDSSFAVGRKREAEIQNDDEKDEGPIHLHDTEADKTEADNLNEKAWNDNRESSRTPPLVGADKPETAEKASFINDRAEGSSSAVDPLMTGERRRSSNNAVGTRHGRRRSTEIRAPPPELEALMVANTEGTIAL